MKQFAQAGDFCPNEGCPDYGRRAPDQSASHLRKFGKTKRGVQRYQCKTCGQTFTATSGTLFYRKRTAEKEILETLALLAEGSRISRLARAKGFKADTILAWLREAAHHAEQLEAELLADFQVKRGQLDALWAYVGNKGEKKTTQRAP
jgi:transposase-like protein